MSARTFNPYRRYSTPLVEPTATNCRLLRIPDDQQYVEAIYEVLGLLADPDSWEEIGISPEIAADLAAKMIVDEGECPPESGIGGVLYQEHVNYILDTANVSSLGFDLLPSDWRRCRIEIAGRATVAGEQDIRLRFNYDEANNYGYHSSVMTSSVTLGSGDDDFIRVSDALTGSNRGAGSIARTIIEITQPTNNDWKTYLDYRVAGFYRTIVGSGYWQTPSVPISSIDIGVVYGEYALGCEFDIFLGWDDA